MQSLSARIRSRLQPDQVSAREMISAARSDYAARGFSELGGPYFSDLSNRATRAMQSIYDAAIAGLVEHCALSGRPSSEFASEFLSLLNELIEEIVQSVGPELGGSNTASGATLEVTARNLVRQAKDRVGAF
jgi:hypothetical protein